MQAYNVAIIGAAGFTGAELVRLLLAHPHFDLVAVSSDTDAGKPLAEVYPNFLGRTELSLVPHQTILSELEAKPDVVFLAVPHTAAMKMAAVLITQGIAVIDLSADFRLNAVEEYEQWYGAEHSAPELLTHAVYGLPEVFRAELSALSKKREEADTPVLVANPGCYPTASTLAAMPVVKAGLLSADDIVVINAISGVSGAGRKATETTQFCLANESLNAYGVTTHRHTPEIAQTLSRIAQDTVKVQFTPHLAPLNRGMVSTVALRLSESAAEQANAESIYKLYEQCYQDEPFVHVVPRGAMPKSSSVKYSNHAHVGVNYDAANRMVVASCVIDNLGKGAAAQAVQCANIVFTLDETAGLVHEGGLL